MKNAFQRETEEESISYSSRNVGQEIFVWLVCQGEENVLDDSVSYDRALDVGDKLADVVAERYQVERTG